VVDATAEAAVAQDAPDGAAHPYDGETKTMTLGFSDLHVVSAEEIDVFSLNLNTWDEPIPFYLSVEGREFALQPKNTYLAVGYGGALPAWLREEDEAGRLTVLVERDGRYLVYGHDPTAVDEDDEEADDE
jgi:hypothetical protein